MNKTSKNDPVSEDSHDSCGPVIDKKYIPLDKSWINRMGILDIVNGYDDIQKFLATQENLGDDLLALKRSAEDWKSDKPVDVGESGTLYRLLKFVSWKLNLNKKFIMRGTLANRPITDDPSIVGLSQEELLKLDNGTSQWATAAVLLGDPERIPNPPFKLALAYKAIESWKEKRAEGLAWEPIYDETILKQAETYLKLLNGSRTKKSAAIDVSEDSEKSAPVPFIPEQAEDFCFAYVFGYMTAEEGEKRWPALRGHESDRIVEIQETLQAAKEGRVIASRDHRVVQAIAMWGKINNVEVKIQHPEAVNKTWPQFWDFLKNFN